MFDDYEIREQGFSDDGEDIMTREYTEKLINLAEDGTVDPLDMLTNLVGWLSERDVRAFFKDEYSEFDDQPSVCIDYTDSSIDGVYQEKKRSYCLECGEDFEWFMIIGEDQTYTEEYGCKKCEGND